MLLVIRHWLGRDSEKLCSQLSIELVDSSLHVSLYPGCWLCGESQQSVVMCNVAGKYCVNIGALEPSRIAATGTREESRCVCASLYSCVDFCGVSCVSSVACMC